MRTKQLQPNSRRQNFDGKLRLFETGAEDSAALIDENSWQRRELHTSRKIEK
jgi:hypothetical protein